MKNLLLSTVIGLGALSAPNMVSAAEQKAPMVMAQVDVQLGPNGVRIGQDRDGYRGGRRDERRMNFDRGDRRRDFEGRHEGRRDRCRTTIIQRETPYGVRTRRVRECD
jgi:hypothetical protein